MKATASLATAAALAALAIGGCDSNPQVESVDGTWEYSLTSSALGVSDDCTLYSVPVSIQQQNAHFAGTAGAGTVRCSITSDGLTSQQQTTTAGGWAVSEGRVSGDAVTFAIVTGDGMRIAHEGSLTGGRITGTATIAGTPEPGSFRLVRRDWRL